MAEEEKKEQDRQDGFFGKKVESGKELEKPIKYGMAADPLPTFPEMNFKNFSAKDSKQQAPEKTVYHLKLVGKALERPDDIIPIIRIFLEGMIKKDSVKVVHITEFALEFPIAITITDVGANQKIVDIFGDMDDSLSQQFSW